MLCASFLSFSLSLEDALHLLQRFFNSSNQIKQIHTVLITSNVLVSSKWKTKFVYNTLIRSYLTTGQYKASLMVCTIKAACSSFSVSYGVSLHGQALKRVVITPNEAILIHGYVLRREMILTTTLGTALLDMYGKAGYLEMALTIFDQIRDKEVCTWNVVVSALASNGRPKKALEMFEMMILENVHPKGITLLAILTACARSNLVDLGIRLFTSICSEYKIIPTSEHYGCMVDLIGRAGLLVDAVNFVNKLPFELDSDTSILGALLGTK